MKDNYLTVTALTRYVKRKIDTDPHLRQVWLRGEISNFKHHSRGHMYMTIKDDNARIQAVMFSSNNSKLLFRPENGMSVLIRGEVSVYEANGQYQLYIREMEPDGIGALYQAFEQLKEKLQTEGLFLDEQKKEIPAYPNHVGVITSPTGAAVRDIVTTIERRSPAVKITVLPVSVQGPQAVDSIVKKIQYANAFPDTYDVLIVGRGGGSIEELWSFNEEAVARAIYASDIPIISAVGHETDTTIADFVSDLRAPTPTGAAELAVPSQAEQLDKVSYLKQRLTQFMRTDIQMHMKRLESLSQTYAFKYPKQLIAQKEQELDNMLDTLNKSLKSRIEQKQIRYTHLKQRLDTQHPEQEIKMAAEKNNKLLSELNRSMKQMFTKSENELQASINKLTLVNPLAIMARGYGISYNSNGDVVKSIKDVREGETMDVRLKDGYIQTNVQKLKEVEQHDGREEL
ncbi:exodeoxyribonuclease VII large subunit [Oceanobacillus jeddahense]|uniref:Exodeoxyribonuclease 7 large subunit n=1 Tax=Oceanobacillus jeddahense TaxID=1462527 RepID=A0ABY5JRQ6_9BACI|nr:exodeoxyribonuclease VII large subunit [Oceanobacillus jeddahense]UUI01299.1 exodeoxyribonuclease VII large subunit [Oceanobacillus jeddahense]